MIRIQKFLEHSSLEVEGEILNVKDGDAIILVLKKSNDTLLIVIDGGDTRYNEIVCKKVANKCKQLKKKGPDLIICTHIDSDHIAGIIAMVDFFKEDIGRIWIHNPVNIINESIASFNNQEALLAIRLLDDDPKGVFSFLSESIKQQKNLIDKINQYKILNDEPFAEECRLDSWSEIEILGPTREFYNTLFDKTFPKLVAEEHSYNLQEARENNADKHLRENPVTTATNNSSVILKIKINTNTLLFTGDAGVKALEKTIGYPNSIRNMTFLKIPHHGSINNITQELIKIINPAIAYNSGDTYESSIVLDSFRSIGTTVISTKEKQSDLTFDF